MTPEGQAMKDRALAGEAVPASVRKGGHNAPIAWAKAEGCYVRIDRKSGWGNTYTVKEHGRDDAIRLYAQNLDPDLRSRVGELRGKVLGCWCAPSHATGTFSQP